MHHRGTPEQCEDALANNLLRLRVTPGVLCQTIGHQKERGAPKGSPDSVVVSIRLQFPTGTKRAVTRYANYVNLSTTTEMHACMISDATKPGMECMTMPKHGKLHNLLELRISQQASCHPHHPNQAVNTSCLKSNPPARPSLDCIQLSSTESFDPFRE